MHLVNNVHPVFPIGRQVAHIVPQVADGIHAVVGGGVNLQNIQVILLAQRLAGLAMAAGFAVHRRGTVDGPGKDARNGRLARPTRPGKKVGMSNPSAGHLIGQRADDGLLPHHLIKALGPVGAVKRLVGHCIPPR